jgi:hypothetical protein
MSMSNLLADCHRRRLLGSRPTRIASYDLR